MSKTLIKGILAYEGCEWSLSESEVSRRSIGLEFRFSARSAVVIAVEGIGWVWR